MTSFTIIGTGNMGTAIGGILQDGGADVRLVTHGETGNGPLGDVVVLAVPHSAVWSVLRAYAGHLDGKVVVDITNPIDARTFDSLVVPADSSSAAQIQQRLPRCTVLKAFNTTFAGTLESKEIGGRRPTVLVAGDDDAAKRGLIELALAAGEKVGWNGGFAVVR
jgi:predicted dinucleotide-binding enzyme